MRVPGCVVQQASSLRVVKMSVRVDDGASQMARLRDGSDQLLGPNRSEVNIVYTSCDSARLIKTFCDCCNYVGESLHGRSGVRHEKPVTIS